MLKKDLLKKVLDFRQERDWKQFHSPKNLAESIVIESTELMEVFQWIDNCSSKKYGKENIDKVKKELADVVIYLVYFCNDLEIDVDKAVESKLKENYLKYPIEKAKGNSKKYTELR